MVQPGRCLHQSSQVDMGRMRSKYGTTTKPLSPVRVNPAKKVRVDVGLRPFEADSNGALVAIRPCNKRTLRVYPRSLHRVSAPFTVQRPEDPLLGSSYRCGARGTPGGPQDVPLLTPAHGAAGNATSNACGHDFPPSRSKKVQSLQSLDLLSTNSGVHINPPSLCLPPCRWPGTT